MRGRMPIHRRPPSSGETLRPPPSPGARLLLRRSLPTAPCFAGPRTSHPPAGITTPRWMDSSPTDTPPTAEGGASPAEAGVKKGSRRGQEGIASPRDRDSLVTGADKAQSIPYQRPALPRGARVSISCAFPSSEDPGTWHRHGTLGPRGGRRSPGWARIPDDDCRRSQSAPRQVDCGGRVRVTPSEDRKISEVPCQQTSPLNEEARARLPGQVNLCLLTIPPTTTCAPPGPPLTLRASKRTPRAALGGADLHNGSSLCFNRPKKEPRVAPRKSTPIPPPPRRVDPAGPAALARPPPAPRPSSVPSPRTAPPSCRAPLCLPRRPSSRRRRRPRRARRGRS